MLRRSSSRSRRETLERDNYSDAKESELLVSILNKSNITDSRHFKRMLPENDRESYQHREISSRSEEKHPK